MKINIYLPTKAQPINYSDFGKPITKIVILSNNLALRIGKLVALRESDIDRDTIHITRGEIKDYRRDKDGTIHRNGYKVVAHPKTDAGIRTLVLTPDAKKYIKMALDENKVNKQRDEDYIFVSSSGERMHEYAVNNVLRRCNTKFYI